MSHWGMGSSHTEDTHTHTAVCVYVSSYKSTVRVKVFPHMFQFVCTFKCVFFAFQCVVFLCVLSLACSCLFLSSSCRRALNLGWDQRAPPSSSFFCWVSGWLSLPSHIPARPQNTHHTFTAVTCSRNHTVQLKKWETEIIVKYSCSCSFSELTYKTQLVCIWKVKG